MHVSVVHGSPSSHASGAPAAHAPDWHVSAPLHALPSEQDVPFATAAFAQPLAALHVSVVHALPSLQSGGVPAAHAPDWHVSAPLHALPSEHDVPFATAKVWQPSSGSHACVVHGSPSSQDTAEPGAHVPDRHVSPAVHALPSEQAVPSGAGAL